MFQGMDVDQAQEFADLLQDRRTRLEDLLASLDAEVQRSGAEWVGPDAESFRASWRGVHASAGQDLLARLDRSREELEQHVEEQNTASDPDGGRAREGTGSTGPGAQDVAYDTGDRGTVDPAIAEAWETMSDEERRLVAQQIVNEQFERYGLDPVDITFEDMSGNGYWSEGGFLRGDKLAINPERLALPDILHTLAHEVRHAAQHEFVDRTAPGFWDWLVGDSTGEQYEQIEQDYGVTREEIDAWRENFDDYQSPPERPGTDATAEQEQQYQEDFQRYLDQAVEVDARRGGRGFVDSMTFEDLQRYQNSAGVPASEEPE